MKIIKIGAIWCPACLIMTPRWNKIAGELNIEIESYDYDIDKDIVDSLNVGKILPEVIIYKEDKEIDRLIGEFSEKKIKEKLEGYRK